MSNITRTIIFEGRPPIRVAVGDDLPFAVIDEFTDGSKLREDYVLVVRANRKCNTVKPQASSQDPSRPYPQSRDRVDTSPG